MTEPLLCPFCNSEPHLGVSRDRYFIGCENLSCPCSMVESQYMPNKEAAIATWNTRAPGTCKDGSQVATGLANLECGVSTELNYTEQLLKAIKELLVDVPYDSAWGPAVRARELIQRIEGADRAPSDSGSSSESS